MQLCVELEKQEQYQEESMKRRLKVIYEEIKQNYEKIRKEGVEEILEKLNELQR